MRHKRAFLALEDDTRFQCLYRVPHVLADVHTIAALQGVEDDVFNDGAVVVVGGHTQSASQQNEGLFLGGVMMNRHNRAWLNSIQKPVALLFQ